MKYVISESKINSFIYDYLNQNYTPDLIKNYTPDGNWLLPHFLLRLATRDKSLEFTKDGNVIFVYVYLPKKSDILNKPKTLLVWPSVTDNLDSLFSHLWIPVFKKWFEDNTGLPVEHFDLHEI